MTYKLLRHKDFTAEWEKLPVAIRDQFKKKLAKVIEQPHIPKNMLRGDLAGCYKIKLLKAGVRLVYQVKDDRHCCKVSDEAAFCLIQRPYISKTLLTRRISPRGSP
ncbi:hypothetical protein KAM398_28180 [Acinetobacter sp. KAM398]|nr:MULTISPECIES: type II toxin-antitoxin system RelE/ParE family toxin [unclassified Acinetobacter]GJC44114.1 hypothetical protein KAM396_28110 [Acinetobacter sp. KAM396]GJC58222.1 hypothetical protein KAM401_28090 [Acinetobacter sp. KAM401]GJC61043.1 hypothetical protein KAM402_28150 [Acinetobacter sp. KAM402]GJC63865.1 hypothetical protein KAM403_28150 [Acinetobacter sp. KAM403]GJC69513.1 hypothetical protein KAM405_28180 [Acinetobacter sp. KAM405]